MTANNRKLRMIILGHFRNSWKDFLIAFQVSRKKFDSFFFKTYYNLLKIIVLKNYNFNAKK